MDENKINPEIEETSEERIEEQTAETVTEQPEETVEAETVEVETVETEAAQQEQPKEQNEPAEEEVKPKKLRNQAFLRRGSFSLAITAVVIAGIVVLNILAVALSKRVSLEYDMTPEKRHTMSAENIEFLKKVKKDVTITVCADEENYASNMYQMYGEYITSNPTEYFYQTETLLKKYPLYNKKITLKYVDVQTSEFMQLFQKYSSDGLNYGSIIVTAGKGESEMHKILSFEDIYQLSQDYTEITGNNVESAVTGAISYVAAGQSRKIALLTGHSPNDELAPSYKQLLEKHDYTVSEVKDQNLYTISNEYDAIAIVGPTIDFNEKELTAISDFLRNDGKRNKSLLYFPAMSEKPLTDFNNFLAEWGVTVGKGVLYETDENKHYPQTPILIQAPLTEEHIEMGGGITECLIGLGVALTEGSDAAEQGVKTDVLAKTSDTVVELPFDVVENWDGSGNYKKKSYCGAIRCELADTNEDNEEIKSQVFVFSGSTVFLTPDFDQYLGVNVANENLVLSCTQLATGGDGSSIYFEPKNIANNSFTSEKDVKIVQRLFMGLIPLLVIAAGIVVYVRRRNAR